MKLKYANAFLLIGEKTVLVDTGHPDDFAHIMEELEEAGVSPSTISLIVLTHGHADHVGGTVKWKELTGAPVMMHKADVDMVESARNRDCQPLTFWGKVAGSLVNFRYPKFTPDIQIESETDLSQYGIQGKVVPTGGSHTKGSLALILADGRTMAGDLLRGAGSTPKLPTAAENPAGIKDDVKALLEKGATKLYVGMGGPLEKSQIEKAILN